MRIYRSVQLEASPASDDAHRMEDGVRKMRKSHLIAAVLSVALMSYAGLARAQNIVGSLHDLTVGETITTTQVCAYCHTPHNTSAAEAPLWNRNASAETYAMYTSPTIDGAIAGVPGGVSMACLSCHDGSTTFDSLVNAPSDAAAKTGVIVGVAAVGAGGVLTNDHPISVTYGVDTQLVAAVAGKVGAPLLPLYGAGSDQVECASCHNPHDNTTNAKFLRVSTAASALCTTCHVK